MSTRNRCLAVACAAILLLVGVEVGINRILGPGAHVQLDNAGDAPIEQLRVVYAGGETWVGRLEPGASARVFLRGRSKGSLVVDYQQRGSALSGFQVPGFDPAALARENFKLVLRIRPDEFERFQEDGEPSTLQRLSSQARRWLEETLKSY